MAAMNPYLLPTFTFGPMIVQNLLEQIPEARWDEQKEVGRFTVREVIAHLADWDQIWLSRIQKGVDEPGYRVESLDVDQLAIDHQYSLQDPKKTAERYALSRQQMAAFLNSMTPQQFGNTVEHPDFGTVSLEDIANLILAHDIYHIQHLSEFLA